jgi:hypothetical protein
VLLDSAFTDWLIGVSGALVFVATAVLAFLASKQMGKLAEQAQAAKDQVEIMRAASEAEGAAVQEQIRASVAQGEAIREATRGQLQPIVFAHGGRTNTGPNDEYDLSARRGGLWLPPYERRHRDRAKHSPRT